MKNSLASNNKSQIAACAPQRQISTQNLQIAWAKKITSDMRELAAEIQTMNRLIVSLQNHYLKIQRTEMKKISEEMFKTRHFSNLQKRGKRE